MTLTHTQVLEYLDARPYGATAAEVAGGIDITDARAVAALAWLSDQDYVVREPALWHGDAVYQITVFGKEAM